jgi:hypothetical protein
MNKFTTRAHEAPPIQPLSIYDKYGLRENPFPSTPIINRESTNDRINGNIYEPAIRQKEFERLSRGFLERPQNDPNHNRLGYIIDTSYVGRGNGKSAFLVNVVRQINDEFDLDISNGVNKCFALYLSPEPGGRTKTFLSFTDRIFEAILSYRILDYALSVLRIRAIEELYPNFRIKELPEDDAVLDALSSKEWYQTHKLDLRSIENRIVKNDYLQELPPEFPLFINRGTLFQEPLGQKHFSDYYQNLRGVASRLEFVFDHLIAFFCAATFNGAYVFVDDFERIPDFQSARQKRDFAFELRSCLFDGSSRNAKLGFVDLLLVLHAGVPRLIADAWAESGMDSRAPIVSQVESDHIISFEPISRQHAQLLLKKYLVQFRTRRTSRTLYPFTEDAVDRISELAELNAAKILRLAYQLLEIAAKLPNSPQINKSFVDGQMTAGGIKDYSESVAEVESTDLIEKADE